MTTFSSAVAALGLIAGSAAVVIGAMLIAPLMSPLMGFALGLTQGQPRTMQRAVLTVVKGVILVLLLTVVQRGTGFFRNVMVCRWLEPDETGKIEE